MKGFDALARDLKTALQGTFATVRITTVQTNEQMLQEMAAVNQANLPAVLIVFEGWEYSQQQAVRDTKLSLVLVDRFRAGAEDKAFSALAQAETLFAMFPGRGVTIADVRYLPRDCQLATPDRQFVCFALGLSAKE